MIREYLKEKGVDSVDKLTDLEVKKFFFEKKFDFITDRYIKNAMEAVKCGDLPEERLIESFRKSMMGYGRFACYYIENESANGHDDLPKEHGWVVKP